MNGTGRSSPHHETGVLGRLEGVAARGAPPKDLTVVFHGGKSGAGATMLAAECASLVARSGRKVATVDADLYRGCLNYFMDVTLPRGACSLLDLLPVIDELTPRVLDNALAPSRSGAMLLAAPESPRDRTGLDSSHAPKLLGALTDHYGTVLVDTPPALDPLTLAFVLSADRTVLVVTPEVACLGAARRALDDMAGAGLAMESVDLVVNRSLGGADGVSVSEIEGFLELPVLLVLPEDSPRCRRLGDEGRAISAERSRLGSGLVAMAARLFGI